MWGRVQSDDGTPCFVPLRPATVADKLLHTHRAVVQSKAGQPCLQLSRLCDTGEGAFHPPTVAAYDAKRLGLSLPSTKLGATCGMQMQCAA